MGCECRVLVTVMNVDYKLWWYKCGVWVENEGEGERGAEKGETERRGVNFKLF